MPVEGELIFRWIYDFLGCTKPFRRLWISSLTDGAIRKGLEELKDGSGTDSLYAAAGSRAKADPSMAARHRRFFHPATL